MPVPTRSSGAARSRTVARLSAVGLLFTLIAAVQMMPLLRHAGDALYVGTAVSGGPALSLLANAGDANASSAATAGTVWDLFRVADTLRGVYTLAWWAHRLLDRVQAHSFYDANMLFPFAQALTYSDLQIGVVPWFTPLYALTGNPALAYNLTSFVGSVGCAVLFFVLLRSWTGSTGAGIVAGVSSLLAPYRVRWMPLLYLHFLLYLPIALLCVDAVAAARRTKIAAVGLGASLVLQAGSSGYLAYVTFVLVPIHALVAIWETPRERRARIAAILAGVGAVAAIAVAVLYRPFAMHAAAGGFRLPDADGSLYHPLLALAWVLAGGHVWPNLVGSVGLPFLCAAALGLFNREGRGRMTGPLVVATGMILMLGPTTHLGSVRIAHLPWEWLTKLVPGFNVQRHQYFPETLIGVGLTLLAGHGAAWLMARVRAQRVWAIVGGAFGVASVVAYGHRLNSAHTIPVATGSNVPAAYRWLADHGEGMPLLELPNQRVQDAIYMYFSAYHWLPLYNGAFSYPPPGYEATNEIAMSVLSPSDPAASAFLRAVPVTWVLVHGNLIAPDDFARIGASPPPRLELAARFDADLVFRVRAAQEP